MGIMDFNLARNPLMYSFYPFGYAFFQYSFRLLGTNAFSKMVVPQILKI